MAAPAACLELQAKLDTARGVRAGSLIFSANRKTAKQDVKALARKYRACIKANASKRGILYVRALAQVASDVGVKFPLKPDFERGTPLGKVDDTIRRALKITSNKDILSAGQAFSKKHKLGALMEPALVLEALEDTRKKAKTGFVVAQIAATVGDAVAVALTAGAYAAAAPLVHGAIASGGKLTLQTIDADIARNRERYKRELSKRKLKADTVDQEQQVREQAANEAALLQAAQDRLQEARSSEDLVSPWYMQPLTLLGGAAFIGAGIYWYTKRKKP